MVAEQTEQTARLNGLKIRQTPDRVLWVQLPSAPLRQNNRMRNNKNIVLELIDDLEMVFVDVLQTNLLIIGALQNPAAKRELLSAAASKVRGAVCSVDALCDKIQQARGR